MTRSVQRLLQHGFEDLSYIVLNSKLRRKIKKAEHCRKSGLQENCIYESVLLLMEDI